MRSAVVWVDRRVVRDLTGMGEIGQRCVGRVAGECQPRLRTTVVLGWFEVGRRRRSRGDWDKGAVAETER